MTYGSFRVRATLVGGIALLLAVPAALLSSTCRGEDCEEGPRRRVPFCSLPQDLREDLLRGFRAGRSADIVAVTSAPTIGGSDLPHAPTSPWPTEDAPTPRLPIAFWGNGIDEDPGDRPGVTLDDVAPTLAAMGGIERPHPEVRTGAPVQQSEPNSIPSRLLVSIAWKTVDGNAETVLAPLLARGTGSLRARAGSQPLDPAALVATIGTGAPPDRHGITGAVLRDNRGRVAQPWSTSSLGSVIAALGDDLLEQSDGAARVALVATHPTDRGLVGEDWYLRGDVVREVLVDPDNRDAIVSEVIQALEADMGTDDFTDLLAVGLEGTSSEIGPVVQQIERAAVDVSDGLVTFALAGAGIAAEPFISGPDLVTRATDTGELRELVAVTHGGGLFLDQRKLARREIHPDAVVNAVRGSRLASGERAFTDVFATTALTFARYC